MSSVYGEWLTSRLEGKSQAERRRFIEDEIRIHEAEIERRRRRAAHREAIEKEEVKDGIYVDGMAVADVGEVGDPGDVPAKFHVYAWGLSELYFKSRFEADVEQCRGGKVVRKARGLIVSSSAMYPASWCPEYAGEDDDMGGTKPSDPDDGVDDE